MNKAAEKWSRTFPFTMNDAPHIVDPNIALMLDHTSLILRLQVALTTVLTGLKKMEEQDAYLLLFAIRLAQTPVAVPMTLSSVQLAPPPCRPICLIIH
jgi:hypothetical protein